MMLRKLKRTCRKKINRWTWLVFGCFVVLCMVLLYSILYCHYNMTGVSTRTFFPQVGRQGGRRGKPYLIPSDSVLRNLSEMELVRIYWRYIYTLQTLCRNQSRFGSLMDGGKEVCLDGQFNSKPPCIVYSFGKKINSRTWLVFGCFVVLGMVLLYYILYCHYNMTSVSTRTFFPQVERQGGRRGKPYLIPSDSVLRNLSEMELVRIYWRYIYTLQTLCQNQSRFGSLMDGGKEVCLDGQFGSKPPCIVYSFGSNLKFDFDVTARRYLGCEVYTFDPTTDIRGKQLPKEIKYIEVGLAGKDYITDQNWKMKPLESIIKDNSHQNDVIDIVKIDIEGSEWSSLPNIIETGVHRQIKQLLVEFHFGHQYGNPKLPYWGYVQGLAEQLRALRLLYEGGFRIFMRDRVYANFVRVEAPPQHVISPQMEISLINMAYVDD